MKIPFRSLASLILTIALVTLFAVPLFAADHPADATASVNVKVSKVETPPNTATTASVDMTAVTTVREQEFTTDTYTPPATAAIFDTALPDIESPADGYIEYLGRPPSSR